MVGLPAFRLAVVIAIVMSLLSSIPASFVAADSAPSGLFVASDLAQDCDFVFGFATIRDALGSQTVGNCVEDQRFIPGNGSTEQRTTNGLLVFSALDGLVRFTTQNRTWILTPSGIADRPNDTRFEWEGDRQLVEDLRQGGYIIYFRHSATDNTQQDSDPRNLTNCATQRNLTDQGRNLAATIGIQIRNLQIPVGLVLSSPYCRAREHASLSFGLVDTEPTLQFYEALPRDEWPAHITAFQRVLGAAVPPAGANLVMVSHSPNIRDAAGIDLPVEGGAAILALAPDGGTPTLVARVLPTEWAVWAEAMAAR
jgi:phosphohistidine phosphatase SixA